MFGMKRVSHLKSGETITSLGTPALNGEAPVILHSGEARARASQWKWGSHRYRPITLATSITYHRRFYSVCLCVCVCLDDGVESQNERTFAIFL